MAKRRTQSAPRGTNQGDFAGPDAEKEAIEKLANAAQEANAKAGHNSGEPPGETVRSMALLIEADLVEIDAALKIVQKARADFGATRKRAKNDLGSKTWVDAIVAAVKLKRQSDKGGTGSIVTEHRQIGRVLRLMDCPLGTQWSLFAVPEEKAAEDAPANGVPRLAEAELAGQHAASNGEPRSNNPWQPGSQNHVDWDAGHANAEAAFQKMTDTSDSATAH